jgi:hypothetical protein
VRRQVTVGTGVRIAIKQREGQAAAHFHILPILPSAAVTASRESQNGALPFLG